jgi:hypothetical protein
MAPVLALLSDLGLASDSPLASDSGSAWGSVAILRTALGSMQTCADWDLRAQSR